MKRLSKSDNKMICGVCGGVAEYLGVDPTLIRLAWALIALSGAGLLAYIIAAIVIPDRCDIE